MSQKYRVYPISGLWRDYLYKSQFFQGIVHIFFGSYVNVLSQDTIFQQVTLLAPTSLHTCFLYSP